MDQVEANPTRPKKQKNKNKKDSKEHDMSLRLGMVKSEPPYGFQIDPLRIGRFFILKNESGMVMVNVCSAPLLKLLFYPYCIYNIKLTFLLIIFIIIYKIILK